MIRSEASRTRQCALGTLGAVAAHNREASDVGIRVLSEGGTAFDAIVAMSATTAVRETSMSGIGGGGVFLGYHAASQSLREINFYGRSPRALPEDVFVPHLSAEAPKMEFGWSGTAGNVSQRGALSVGVPGFVSGLAAVHSWKSTMPWSDLLADAQQLADRGFRFDEEDVYFLIRNLSAVADNHEAARLYLPGGIRRIGAGPLVLPDLARTLSKIRSEGTDGFYAGETATATVDAVQSDGGYLTLQDLQDFRPESGDGTAFTYHGVRVHTAGGMLGGITLLTILNLAQAAGLSQYQHNSADYLTCLARIMRHAWLARFNLLRQDEITQDDLDGLLGSGFATGFLSNATADPEQLDPELAGGRPGWAEPNSHTTSIAAVDADGNLATITQTLGKCYGSGIAGSGTGALLYNLMYWFDPQPGSISSAGGWKRPSGHASPVILTKDGAPFAALSAPGGRSIVTGLAQVILNMIDQGMDVQQAISAPRIHTEGVSPIDPSHTDRKVVVDHRISDEVVQALRAQGFEVTRRVASGVVLPFGRPTGVQFGSQLGSGVDINGKSVALAISGS